MKNAKHKFKINNASEFEALYYFQDAPVSTTAQVFPPHLHDAIEAYVLLSGDVSFAVESSVYKLKPGDIVITKPNEMHNCVVNTTSFHKHMCFWFYPTNEFLFSDFLSHDFGKNNVISPDEKAKKRLSVIYDDIKTATESKNDLKRFYLFLEMIDIFKTFANKNDTPITLPQNLKLILDDIDLNFKTLSSLDYFTEKYFLSQSTLNRLFKKYLHTTPKLYVETKRLAHARQLLKEGHSVLTASSEAGFTDYSNFIRLFKKRFNITPKRYKDD